jgi:hypothetical protein
MVLFDKLSFSQGVGIFQAFKLYYARGLPKKPVAVNTTEKSEKAESDMEFSLCGNEKVFDSDDSSIEIIGQDLVPR